MFSRFHFFLFDQVLEVAKKFLVYDGTENYMFVVPVKNNSGYDIDWETMQRHQEVPPLTTPSFEVS